MRKRISSVAERSGGGAERRPLFFAALVTVAAVAAAGAGVAWGVLVGVGAGVAGWFCGGWRRAVFWLGCGLVAVVVFAVRDSARRQGERVLLAASGGVARGRVLEDASGSERHWMAPVRLTGGEVGDGLKVWWEGRGEVPVAGAVVEAFGDFEELEGPRNPGEFDRAKWLRGQGVSAVFRPGWARCKVEVGWRARVGAALRRGFRERVTAGLPEDGLEVRVIRAVVIGEKPRDSDALIAAFRESGSLHVFSVSGLHVTMVCGIAWLVLSFAGVTRQWSIPLLVPVAFGYAWLTGWNPPAVRASWMLAVFLGAFGFRRRPDLLNALGAVLLVGMLCDGRMLFQAGVQLSYGVVAAIAVGVSLAARLYGGLAAPEMYLPEDQMNRWQAFWLRLRRWAAGMLGTSTAAAVGSAPLTAWHFGLFTPVSIVAALVLIPTVFAMLWLALAGVAVSFLSVPASHGLNQVNGVLAKFAAGSARWFASLPGGHFKLRGENGPSLLVYDLEYGAGGACFSGGDGAAVLIDCGDANSFQYRVTPSLRSMGVEPDSVVLTHPDGGHLGGGSVVWEAFPVRQVLMPVALSRSPSFGTWVEQGPAAGLS
ncbi:MAG: ComEC/Rec2 family competence protein, partial [Verrucomicrobiales bacterium]